MHRRVATTSPTRRTNHNRSSTHPFKSRAAAKRTAALSNNRVVISSMPHMTNMKMLGTDVSRYPVMARIFDTCMRLEAFSLEAPMQQPDAPKAK